MDRNGKKIEVEFQMSLVPSSLKFTVYLMDQFASWALNSERFDFKARANEEDLESRREWYSANSQSNLGDVFILEPLSMRGQTLEIDIKFPWAPCLAILRWKLGEVFLHVAVRPSPPYRTWVKDFLAPVTWKAAVTHADKNLTRLLNLRPMTHEPSSSSPHPSKAGPPPHLPREVSPKHFAKQAYSRPMVIVKRFRPRPGILAPLRIWFTWWMYWWRITLWIIITPPGRSSGYPSLMHSE